MWREARNGSKQVPAPFAELSQWRQFCVRDFSSRSVGGVMDYDEHVKHATLLTQKRQN